MFPSHDHIGGFPDRPRVWMFRVDWAKVQSLISFGKFNFTFTTKNGAGKVVNTQTSPCFHLMPFDCDLAHGTIRIETLQTGYIFNGFDYRDLFSTTLTGGGLPVSTVGVKQQIRWYGRLYPDIPEEESDFIQTADRKEIQIQQKVTEKFKLLINRVKSPLGQLLIKDQFLADEILISDYNKNSYEVYRDKSLRKVSTDEFQVEKLQSGVNLIYTFKDIDEGTVKRIYG